MFPTETLKTIGKINTMHCPRKYARGFVPFYNDVLNLIGRKPAIEFGVSGGGTHHTWTQQKFKRVLGIDVINYPSMTFGQTGRPMFDEGNTDDNVLYWKNAIELAIQTAEESVSISGCQLEFKFGYDAYNKDDVQKALAEFNCYEFSLIVDDGASWWPAMKDSLDVWKPYIDANGIFVTETPDGNGTPDWRAETYEEHMEHFAILAEKGITVLDLKSFQPDWAVGDEDWESTYIGFWTPNVRIHDIIMEKYGKYKVN